MMVIIIAKRIKWNLNKTLTKYSEVVAADWVKRATQQQCQLFYCSSHSNITRAIRAWVIYSVWSAGNTDDITATCFNEHSLNAVNSNEGWNTQHSP